MTSFDQAPDPDAQQFYGNVAPVDQHQQYPDAMQAGTGFLPVEEAAAHMLYDAMHSAGMTANPDGTYGFDLTSLGIRIDFSLGEGLQQPAPVEAPQTTNLPFEEV